MTLARTAERIQEEKAKHNKVDGRRFSKRFHDKIKYELIELQRADRNRPRRGGRALICGMSREEFEHYKKEDKALVDTTNNARMVSKILDEILDTVCENNTSDK